MKKVKVVLPILLILIMPVAAHLQEVADPTKSSDSAQYKALSNSRDDTNNDFNNLNSILESAVDSYGLSGLAAGVVQNGKMVYAKGFGYADIRSKEPITPNTIFHSASISKTLVATAVMQLQEQGKLDIDSPLIEYLPYFKLADEQYRHITIRQMLTHTSGFPDVKDYEWTNPQYDDKALEKYVI